MQQKPSVSCSVHLHCADNVATSLRRNDTSRAVYDALIDCRANLRILDLGEGCS